MGEPISTLAGILMLVNLAVTLVRSGLLALADLQTLIVKYRDLPATPENQENFRQELLAKSKRPHPVDDPEIRADLLALGIDPESLRLPGA